MPALCRFAVLAFIFTLGACSSVGVGGSEDVGPSFPQVAGAWSGSMNVDGDALTSSLTIEQEGPDLGVTVRIPDLELVSRGEGTVLPDGTTRIGFEYEFDCPGRAELIGELSSDGTTLSGTLVATDCTGEQRGTFIFAR